MGNFRRLFLLIWNKLVSLVSERPALTLFVSAVIFSALGSWQDGIFLDSSTYAVIARNMAEKEQWFNPTYTPYCHPHFAEHPPLVMWAQAVIFWLFGASDTTARFFGALCTIGSVLMVYLLGREISGKRYGLLAGIVLLLTYNFMQIGNSTLLDVPMTFFVLVVLWGLVRLSKDYRCDIRIYIITGFALGATFLTKGVVSGPIWLVFGLTVLFGHRTWLKRPRFWLIPIIAVIMIGIYLLMDYMFADGHFTHHYFAVQVWRRFSNTGGGDTSRNWLFFSYRFLQLYLPFVILLPFGLFLAIKKRLILLYPAILTFAFYYIFYSSAAKLYNHYFPPFYALSALLVALPLLVLIKEKYINAVGAGFFVLWVFLAVTVISMGLRIHEIRYKAIYDLTPKMTAYLENHQIREGLMVRVEEPDYDAIAKTSWYWRSDIATVPTFEKAVETLHKNDKYQYILVYNDKVPDSSELANFNLTLYAQNSKLAVIVACNP